LLVMRSESRYFCSLIDRYRQQAGSYKGSRRAMGPAPTDFVTIRLFERKAPLTVGTA